MEFYLNFKMPFSKKGFKVGSKHFKGGKKTEIELETNLT